MSADSPIRRSRGERRSMVMKTQEESTVLDFYEKNLNEIAQTLNDSIEDGQKPDSWIQRVNEVHAMCCDDQTGRVNVS